MSLAFKINAEPAARLNRIAISLFFFVAGLTFATWASRIPDIKLRLQLSDAALGSLLFALPVGLLTSLPISGWLVAKLGSRKLLIASAILYPASLLILALSGSVWLLGAGLFFFGLFSNMMNISMNTQAVNVEAAYGRSIMASFHGMWSVGGFTGALAGTAFIAAGASVFMHFLLICLFSGLLIALFYKNISQEDPGGAGSTPLFVKPPRSLMLLGVIAFCCLLAEGAMADWSGVYFQKEVKAPASMITIGYLAFTATMAIGRFVGDWLVVRFSVQRMLQLSGTVIATGLFIAVLFPYLAAATFGFLLVGFGVSSVVPIVYGLAGKSRAMPTSVALAAVSTIGFSGFLLGPPLIGFIAELSSLRISFAFVGILGLGTAMLASRVGNSK